MLVKLKVIALLLLGACSMPLLSAELKQQVPNHYIVQEGDTLWGIADLYYRDPWDWRNIWHWGDSINNAHEIYPGDVVGLVQVDGQYRLTIIQPKIAQRTIKLSPSVRKSPLKKAIPTIPMNVIEQFLIPARVETPYTLEQAGYVAALSSDRVMAASGDALYVRGLDEMAKGDYGVYRIGDAYVDPATKEMLGLEVVYLGKARLSRSGNPATMVVQESTQEILRTDLILPLTEERFSSRFIPHVPETPVFATIISVYGGVSQIGQYDLVVINRGQADQIEEGLILGVYQDGDWVHDPMPKTTYSDHLKIPDERAGVMMILKVFDRVSMGIILKATQAIHLLDIAVNP